MVQAPTRENNILDLLLTTIPDQVHRTNVVPGISDHSAISAELSLRAATSKKKPRKVLIYGKIKDKEGMAAKINEFVANITTNWQDRSVDQNWTQFKDGLRSIILQFIPEKTIREKHHLPWINHTIKKLLKRKKRRYDKAKRTQNNKHWEAYKRLQQECRNAIKSAHEQYLQGLFEEDSGKPSKKFWRTIKSRRKDNIGVPPLRDRNGILVTTSKGKAQILSDQYQKVFTNEDLQNVPTVTENHPNMNPIIISERGVTSLLKKLNTKKAIGPDLVSTRVLKEHAESIAPALTRIYQQSLDTGEVPEDWRKANITAIYKKSDKQDPANYRPVSLTSVACRCLEHIIFSEIMNHLDTHDILVHNQHGFRSKRSTETQLITTVEDLAQIMDKRGHADVLILDFCKAFDTVAHVRLLNKLEGFGINGSTHQWIRNWLTKRTQTVVIDGESSTQVRVGSGVPQGTVLGPLMFLLFINDIGKEVKESKLRLFADDCLLYRDIRSTSDMEALQKDLDSLSNWANTWQMQFNAAKCHQLRITNQRSPTATEYKMNGHTLQRVEHHPYLGVELSDKLSWSHHIDNSCQKANRSLNFIRRNLGRCSQATKTMAYKSLVQPHLQYASSAWDPHQRNHIDKLEKVQSKAARFILRRYGREESVTAMREELGLQTQQACRFVNRMTMFYKSIHGHVILPLPNCITRNVRETRGHHPHQFTLPSVHLDSYKFSFFPHTIRCWSILPVHIISSVTPETFKSNLQKALTKKEIIMVPPCDIYNRPRLGSGSDLLPRTVF